MLPPTRSVVGNYILIGAMVGADGFLTYSRRVKPNATRDELRGAYSTLREQIHKDHPGIKEEYTIYRPKVGFN